MHKRLLIFQCGLFKNFQHSELLNRLHFSWFSMSFVNSNEIIFAEAINKQNNVARDPNVLQTFQILSFTVKGLSKKRYFCWRHNNFDLRHSTTTECHIFASLFCHSRWKGLRRVMRLRYLLVRLSLINSHLCVMFVCLDGALLSTSDMRTIVLM